MLERCKLSKIADYLLTGGVTCDEENRTDYETEIRNMEVETEKLLEKYFPDIEEQEEIYNEISRREMLIKNIYFQFGLIAGLNISGQITDRAAELGQQPLALFLRSREEERHRARAYVRAGYGLVANVKHLTLKALLFKQSDKRLRVLGCVGVGNAYIRLFIGGKRAVFFGKGVKRRLFAAHLSAGDNMSRFITL